MHRYQPRTPRTAIGLAAIVLTAVTLGGAVLWPALAETARATEAGAATVTGAAAADPRHMVALQCPPQG